MKRRIWILLLIELYQLGTLALFLASPINFYSKNIPTMVLFVVLYQVVFVGGFIYATNHLETEARDITDLKWFAKRLKPIILRIRAFWNKTDVNLFFLLAILLSILFSYVSMVRYSLTFDLRQILNDLLYAIRNTHEAYLRNWDQLKVYSGSSLETMVSTLFAPFIYFAGPIGLYSFRKLNVANRILLLISFLLDGLTYVIRGTNIGVFRIIILIMVVLALKLNKSLVFKRYKTLIITTLASLGSIFLIYFFSTIGDRIDTFPKMIAGRFIDYGNFLFKILPKVLWTPLVVLTSYLSQGYLGFAYSFNYRFTSTFGLGNNYFFIGQIKRFGLDILPMTYIGKMNYVWDAQFNWHTFYTWMANDVSYYGVFVVMLFLGIMTSLIIHDADEGNYYAIGLLPLYAIMLVFLPANNVVLSTPVTSMSFMALNFMYLSTRKISRKSRRKPVSNMSKKPILVLIRDYFPDVSASGNVVKGVFDRLAQTRQLTILTNYGVEKPVEMKGIVRIRSKNIYVLDKMYQPDVSSFKRFFYRVVHRVLSVWMRRMNPRKVNMNYYHEAVRFIRNHPDAILMPVTFDEIACSVYLKRRFPSVSLNPYIMEIFPGYIGEKATRNYIGMIERYSDRIFLLPYLKGYFHDESKLVFTEHPMVVDSVQELEVSDKIKITYVGGLNLKSRNPQFFLDLLEQSELTERFQVEFYTYGNCIEMLNKFARSHPYFRSFGKVSNDLAHRYIARTTLLLTIGNKDSKLVPSKLFDCISTGNPIAHFYFDDDDPYLTYLKPYRLSICLKIGDKETLRRFEEFALNTHNRKIKFEEIGLYYRDFTPDYVCSQIEENLDEKETTGY